MDRTDRLGQMSSGFKAATGDNEWQKIKKFFGQFIPEKGESGPVEARDENPNNLGDQIAGVSRMVQNPESDSTDWTSMGTDFMETGNLDDATDEELMMIMDELFGKQGGDRESMIEDLTRFRDRQY